MLKIDRLYLTLPPGYADRAETIARLTAEELAVRPVSAAREMERLVVPAVTTAPGTSDHDLARRIATAIHVGIDDSGGADR